MGFRSSSSFSQKPTLKHPRYQNLAMQTQYKLLIPMHPVQDRAKGSLGVLAYIYLTLLNFSHPISLSLHTAYTFKLSLRSPESNPTCTAISNRHFHPKGSFPHPRSRSYLGLAKLSEYQHLCAFFFSLRALLASLLSF